MKKLLACLLIMFLAGVVVGFLLSNSTRSMQGQLVPVLIPEKVQLANLQKSASEKEKEVRELIIPMAEKILTELGGVEYRYAKGNIRIRASGDIFQACGFQIFYFEEKVFSCIRTDIPFAKDKIEVYRAGKWIAELNGIFQNIEKEKAIRKIQVLKARFG